MYLKYIGKFFIAYILLFINLIYGQLLIQDSGVHVTLRDICFIDSIHGWAVGDSSIIINTINGGDNWERQYCPIDSINLERIQFLNNSNGYIVGQHGTILSTKDGGETWIKNLSSVNYDLLGLYFVNQDTGWVVGGCDECDENEIKRYGAILHTKNGGKNWIKQYETDTLNNNISEIFGDIIFLDDNNGVAIASDYWDGLSITNIYRTYNAGLNWEIFSDIGTPLFRISMLSADTIWAGGFPFVNSYNGGIDWSWNSSLKPHVTDIVQLNNQSGWLISGGNLYFTSDLGENWSEIISNDSMIVNAISSVSKNLFWVAGYDGLVIKFKDIQTNIREINDYTPDKFELSQNFPNPFNSSTTISFSLDYREYVKLDIFDINGKQVKTLCSNYLNPNKYKLIWNGVDNSGIPVSSGIYLYILKAGEHSLIKKAILVK